MRYSFHNIYECNMCGSASDGHEVLGKRLNKSQGKNPRNKSGITTTVMRCPACGLIYSNPQPIPFDLQDHYGIPPEDYWNESYFTIDANYFKIEIDHFKSLIKFELGMKALDIGAGLGKGMIALHQAGFDTYGFEPSKPFHERAISKMGIAADRLKLGGIEDVDYEPNTFDLITFGAVLEHLYSPSNSILKAMQWLKPNGLMHIEVPSSDWLISKIINAYYRIQGLDYVSNISPMHEPFHLHEFGLKSFEAHAKRNHYTLAFHTYYVCSTYMPRVLDLILKPYMKWTDTGMQLCVWLRKQQ